MRNERTKQIIKLRLLAFVLALAILWYSLNPVPKPIVRIKREDELPDEKKREVEPWLQGIALRPLMLATHQADLADKPFPDQDEDDFDWPDLIDA
jgi:hypothetical protein